MSDSIFHHIFFAWYNAILISLFVFCSVLLLWVSVCLSLFICYFTLFHLPWVLLLLLLFLAVHFCLAFEIRCALVVFTLASTNNFTTLSACYTYIFFIRLLCWCCEQWRICARTNKAQSAHKTECCVCLCVIFIYMENCAKNEISQKRHRHNLECCATC